ncbi:MAG: glycosyltransferase [Pirellulales bacterium]
MLLNSGSCPKVPVSVVIPTWRRTDQLVLTIQKILAQVPQPEEILVQVDAGDSETSKRLREEFPVQVRVEENSVTQGPGGSRNLLVRRSKNEVIASFDDDSFPTSMGYFERLLRFFDNYPRAAVLGVQAYAQGEAAPTCRDSTFESRSFENCAAAFRRSALLEVAGFVPLRYAYGMEESDLALQLFDKGWEVFFTCSLLVYHDTDLNRHGDTRINSAHISNVALLGFLRYPLVSLPWIIPQTASRILYAIRERRFQGIGAGIVNIPKLCWKYRNYRQPVSGKTLKKVRSIEWQQS